MSARAHSPPDAGAAGIVLSHGDLGPAGLLGEWLRARGVGYAVHDVSKAPMPSLEGAGFVASLGSEESANSSELPWVAAEIELLREATDAGVPVLGLCFGGQALSIALGGAVATARAPRIGWFELSGTATGSFPAGPWFHWHYEQLSIPPGASGLAASDVGPSAFALGPHLGLQFHPEVTTAVIADWSRSEGELAALGIDPGELIAESERRAPEARERGFALFDAWWAQRAR